jgi:hypothetical protein
MDLREVEWEGHMDWIDLAQDREATGSCKCGNEPSCFIKYEEFLDWLRTCQLLRKVSVAWS